MNRVFSDIPSVSTDGQVTTYDLQEIRKPNQEPQFIVSESRNNTGPGFDNDGVRDRVARQVAEGIQSMYDIEPSQLHLHQQRPDGNFERVSFTDIGRDIGMVPGSPTQWTESNREPVSRADLQQEMKGFELRAPQETLQQEQTRLQKDWRELSLEGPSR